MLRPIKLDQMKDDWGHPIKQWSTPHYRLQDRKKYYLSGPIVYRWCNIKNWLYKTFHPDPYLDKAREEYQRWEKQTPMERLTSGLKKPKLSFDRSNRISITAFVGTSTTNSLGNGNIANGTQFWRDEVRLIDEGTIQLTKPFPSMFNSGISVFLWKDD